MRNRLPLAYDPGQLDAILVTHAHLDHCGFLPVVVRAGYAGPIFSTRGTAELARLVLLDSGKVQVEQSKRSRRRHRHDQAAATPRNPQATAQSNAAEMDTNPEVAVRQQPPHAVSALEEPLYDVEDAQAAVDRFKGIDYDQKLDVAPGISATFRDAG